MWSDDDNAQLPYTNAGYRCIVATLFISRPEYGYRHRQSLRFNTVEVAMHDKIYNVNNFFMNMKLRISTGIDRPSNDKLRFRLPTNKKK